MVSESTPCVWQCAEKEETPRHANVCRIVSVFDSGCPALWTWLICSVGLTFTESWTTANVLGAQLELQDSLIKGLKLDLSGSLFPEKGTKVAKAGFEYKQDYLFTRSSLDLFKGPTLLADAVVGSNGFILGADVSYDVSEAKMTKYNAALGYLAPVYSVSLLA